MVRVDDNTLVRDNDTLVCNNDTLDGQQSTILDGTMDGTSNSMIELQSELGTMLINEDSEQDDDTMKCKTLELVGVGVGVGHGEEECRT